MSMFESPTYLVQLGAQGEGIARETVENGFAKGVVISPISITASNARSFAEEIQQAGGVVLFDPQWYNPRSTDYNLQSYSYYDYGGSGEGFFDESSGYETSVFEDPDRLKEFSDTLAAYQDDIDVDAFIAPSVMLNNFTDANMRFWQDMTNSFIDSAKSKDPDKEIYASIPLVLDTLSEKPQRANLLNWVTSVDVDGFYITAHKEGTKDYPLTGRDSLYSYLNLIKNLKLNRFNVIIGYTHHVAHLLLAAGADAFASGHYINTRVFDKNEWESDGDENGGGQPVIRYYSDHLLNEIRVRAPAQSKSDDDDSTSAGVFSELDILADRGFDISKLSMDSPFEGDLFQRDTPSETDWPMRDGAWNHYLWACNKITNQYEEANLREEYPDAKSIEQARIAHAKSKLEEASELYSEITDYAPLRDPDEKVYDDWPDVIEELEDES